MSDSFPFSDIIFFALIAIFIILRLRAVLGRRTGQGRQRHPDTFARTEKGRNARARKVVPLPDRNPRDHELEDVGPKEESDDSQSTETSEGQTKSTEKEIVIGLRSALDEIKRVDDDFTPRRFIEGAQAAFELIVEAFARGDAPVLKPLLGKEVYDEFASAIRERKANNYTQETTIVALDDAQIISAGLYSGAAHVTVKFVSQQINVTSDADGQEIDGNASRIELVTDIWTFSRNTGSNDPNWALIETNIPN